MKIIQSIKQVKEEIKKIRQAGQTIGFVPTMGFLHEGHLSLVRQSKKENQVTVVSIFVNPTQFGPGEDLDRYPRDFAKDEKLLADLGVDIIFYPSQEEIYPPDYATYVTVDKLAGLLCGKSRPTHFRGVTTVVLKLFNIVTPDTAYFGQKDAQQATIIKRMTIDLNLEVVVRVLPIIRDADGLALSSRNAYLSGAERLAALHLSKGLRQAEADISAGLRSAEKIKAVIAQELAKSQEIKIDYIEIVRLGSLEAFEDDIDINGTLVAVAIKVGSTRLIDNFILGEI